MRHLLLALLLWPSLLLANPCPLPLAEQAQLKRVIDGDTVQLSDGRHLRIIGIDTPELGRDGRADQPFAREAKAYVERLLPVGSRVGLAYDNERVDRHGRTLAHLLRSNGEPLAVALLQQGYARTLVIPPNSRQAACYAALEAQARQQHRGIWQR